MTTTAANFPASQKADCSSLKLRLSRALHARLAEASRRTPFSAAEIIRRAVRSYHRAAPAARVVVDDFRQPATRANSVVMTFTLGPTAKPDRRIQDILAWYLASHSITPVRPLDLDPASGSIVPIEEVLP